MKTRIMYGLTAALLALAGCVAGTDADTRDAALCAAAAEHVASCTGAAVPADGACDPGAAEVALGLGCEEMFGLTEDKTDGDPWYCTYLGIGCGGRGIAVRSIWQHFAGLGWTFTVFLSGSEESLAHVSCVYYLLPSSFAGSSRITCDRDNETGLPFAIREQGYDDIDVRADIVFTDGSVEHVWRRVSLGTTP